MMKSSINAFSKRGIFLVFCCAFITGDIIGISSVFLLYGAIFLPLLGLLAGKRWRSICVFSCIGLSVGLMIGNIGNLSHMQAYNIVSESTHGFELKGVIEGTVEGKIYKKSQSQIYRLHIAKIDSTSPKKESFFTGDPTIFIEVPLNMKINEGDKIAFTGKILENVHFPLSGYDRFSYLKGGYGTIYIPFFQRIETAPITVIEKVKTYWSHVFRSYFPDSIAGTLLGMTVGAVELLSGDIKTIFIQSGISHILVVSGSNIAFLIIFIGFFLKYLPIRRLGRITIVGSIIMFYGLLVGLDVSVIRAMIMGVLSYFIVEYGGQGSGKASLGLAGVVLVCISPLAPLYDAGFGLSFGATLGIITFHGYIERLCNKIFIPKVVTPFISVSIGATLGSLPIMVFHFGTLPLSSIIANILISGILGWILFSSVIFVGIQGLSSFIGYLFGYLVYLPTWFVLWIGKVFSTGIIITIPPSFRSVITLVLLGTYLILFLEKDIINIHERKKN